MDTFSQLEAILGDLKLFEPASSQLEQLNDSGIPIDEERPGAGITKAFCVIA
jgi:hypothetical protein